MEYPRPKDSSGIISASSILSEFALAQAVQGTEPHGLRLRQLIQSQLVLSGLLESPEAAMVLFRELAH